MSLPRKIHVTASEGSECAKLAEPNDQSNGIKRIPKKRNRDGNETTTAVLLLRSYPITMSSLKPLPFINETFAVNGM